MSFPSSLLGPAAGEVVLRFVEADSSHNVTLSICILYIFCSGWFRTVPTMSGDPVSARFQPHGSFAQYGLIVVSDFLRFTVTLYLDFVRRAQLVGGGDGGKGGRLHGVKIGHVTEGGYVLFIFSVRVRVVQVWIMN